MTGRSGQGKGGPNFSGSDPSSPTGETAGDMAGWLASIFQRRLGLGCRVK